MAIERFLLSTIFEILLFEVSEFLDLRCASACET